MYGVTTPRTITASRQYAGAGLAFCWAGLSIKPPSDSLEHETIRLSCSAAPGTCLSSPCVTRLWQPVLTKWTSPISGLDLEQTVLIKYQDLMVIVFSWPSSARQGAGLQSCLRQVRWQVITRSESSQPPFVIWYQRFPQSSSGVSWKCPACSALHGKYLLSLSYHVGYLSYLEYPEYHCSLSQ